jgi:hypothetical protein
VNKFCMSVISSLNKSHIPLLEGVGTEGAPRRTLVVLKSAALAGLVESAGSANVLLAQRAESRKSDVAMARVVCTMWISGFAWSYPYLFSRTLLHITKKEKSFTYQ